MLTALSTTVYSSTVDQVSGARSSDPAIAGREVPAWLEPLLAEPGSGEPLEVGVAGASHRGRPRAPSRGGVLRFVDDEWYAGNFGNEWSWFSQTQLDQGSRAESHDTFFQKTGWVPEQLAGKTVLDVGCGMGRFADIASRYGARVVGIDLSRAVDAAQANLGDRDNVVIIQADVFKLPFRPESFDLIYSIGVLHHTPSTERAFRGLTSLLKPGGKIAIWVYSDEPRLRPYYVVSDVLRRFTSRMDQPRLLRLCRRVAPLGRVYRTRFGRYLSPALPVSSHPNPEWRVLDTFDWYAPKYQWRHTWQEVEGWFYAEGLQEVKRNSVPVAIVGSRPS